MTPIGGGASASARDENAEAKPLLFSSYPAGSMWVAEYGNIGDVPANIRAYAFCTSNESFEVASEGE